RENKEGRYDWRMSWAGRSELEHQSQRQLNVARIVALRQSHHTRRARGQARARRAQLRRIRGIEGLRAKLQPPTFMQREGLEHREVRVRHPGWTEARKAGTERSESVVLLLDEGHRLT